MVPEVNFPQNKPLAFVSSTEYDLYSKHAIAVLQMSNHSVIYRAMISPDRSSSESIVPRQRRLKDMGITFTRSFVRPSYFCFQRASITACVGLPLFFCRCLHYGTTLFKHLSVRLFGIACFRPFIFKIDHSRHL